jgi:hypothetical protein
MARKIMITELGREIECAKCHEFWPATKEFYHFLRGNPHSWCKACYAEWKKAKGYKYAKAVA